MAWWIWAIKSTVASIMVKTSSPKDETTLTVSIPSGSLPRPGQLKFNGLPIPTFYLHLKKSELRNASMLSCSNSSERNRSTSQAPNKFINKILMIRLRLYEINLITLRGKCRVFEAQYKQFNSKPLATLCLVYGSRQGHYACGVPPWLRPQGITYCNHTASLHYPARYAKTE